MIKRMTAIATAMVLGNIPMAWGHSQTIGMPQSGLENISIQEHPSKEDASSPEENLAASLETIDTSHVMDGRPTSAVYVTPTGNPPEIGGGVNGALQQLEASGDFGNPNSPGNLWDHIDAGLSLSNLSRVEVKQWRTWFLQHQGKLEEILSNARPFLYYVVNAVSQRGLPMELALLPAIESGYNPKAYSPAAAAGLWQFVPGTARIFGLQNTRYGDPRLSLTASTNAALDYLSYLYNYFGGNWLLAIAAYNAGQGTVSAAIQQNVAADQPTDFWDLNLPEQTENYVAELLGLAQVIKNAKAYHVSLPYIPNTAHIAVVTTPKSVALNVAAHLMNVPVRELQHLNAGISYGVVPADYQLVVPKDKAATLKTALLTMPQEAAARALPIAQPTTAPAPTVVPASLSHLTVHSGNTLSQIAMRAGVSVQQLKQWNHLRSARDLQIGQQLVVYGGHHLVVRSGNTLSGLAQEAGVSVQDLIRWNHIHSANDLQVGEKLMVYAGHAATQPRVATYIVRKGDTLWQIARQYHVHPKSLVQWNHLASASDIQPGSRLIIYTR